MRPLGGGLHEVRTNLVSNRTARVLFCVDRQERMVLLHGLIKKSRSTQTDDLEPAKSNRAQHERRLLA